MKWILGILLRIILCISCLSTSAQSRGEVEAFQAKLNALLERSMLSKVYPHFSEKFKEKLDSTAFSKVLTSLEIQMGVTRSVSPRTPQYKSPNWLVQNECSFSKGAKLTLQYVLNSQLQIDALSFTTNKPNTKPYTPPSWIEKGVLEQEFTVGQEGSLPLPGKLIPSDSKKIALIIVPDFGPLDMDGTKGKHRPYFELAQGFAKQGIPTFRFNKRTYEHPEKFGGKTLSAEEEYMEDIARVAVELKLMGYENIFLFGHGLGGNVCAYALEKYNIQGAITFGAAFRDFEDLLLHQFKNNTSTDSLALSQFASQVKAAKKAKKNGPDTLGVYPLDLGPKFWWSWHNVDHRNSFRSCLKPVLMTLGGKDVNVPREDYINWLKSMKLNPNVEVQYLDQLNHLMGEGLLHEANETIQHIPIGVLADWANWLHSKVK